MKTISFATDFHPKPHLLLWAPMSCSSDELHVRRKSIFSFTNGKLFGSWPPFPAFQIPSGDRVPGDVAAIL